jgi:hypothetical protein
MKKSHTSCCVWLLTHTQETRMRKPDPAQPSSLNRRSLFAGATTVGAVAAAATLLPGLPEAEPQAAPALPKPERGGGYTLTEHVKQYYKTTRI